MAASSMVGVPAVEEKGECPLCQGSFPLKVIEIHANTCTGEQQKECPFCGALFPGELLVKHIKSFCDKVPVQHGLNKNKNDLKRSRARNDSDLEEISENAYDAAVSSQGDGDDWDKAMKIVMEGRSPKKNGKKNNVKKRRKQEESVSEKGDSPLHLRRNAPRQARSASRQREITRILEGKGLWKNDDTSSYDSSDSKPATARKREGQGKGKEKAHGYGIPIRSLTAARRLGVGTGAEDPITIDSESSGDDFTPGTSTNYTGARRVTRTPTGTTRITTTVTAAAGSDDDDGMLKPGTYTCSHCHKKKFSLTTLSAHEKVCRAAQNRPKTEDMSKNVLAIALTSPRNGPRVRVGGNGLAGGDVGTEDDVMISSSQDSISKSKERRSLSQSARAALWRLSEATGDVTIVRPTTSTTAPKRLKQQSIDVFTRTSNGGKGPGSSSISSSVPGMISLKSEQGRPRDITARAAATTIDLSEGGAAPSSSFKLFSALTYNICFDQDEYTEGRMKAIGDIIMAKSPDVVAMQEVTPDIQKYLEAHPFWALYELACFSPKSPYYTVLLIRQAPHIKVASGIRLPFKNSKMGRDLVIAKIVVYDSPVIVCTTHLESTRRFQEERQTQLVHALDHLSKQARPADLAQGGKNASMCDVVFLGDMNLKDSECVDIINGHRPRWCDTWLELCGAKGSQRFTWDSERNKMIKIKGAVRIRFDRVFHQSCNFEPTDIYLVGTDPIIPDMVWPSDHFGILAEFKKKGSRIKETYATTIDL